MKPWDLVVYWDRSWAKHGPVDGVHYRPRIEWGILLKVGERFSMIHGEGSLRKSKKVRFVVGVRNDLILGKLYKMPPGC
jgi:hypothetical protein